MHFAISEAQKNRILETLLEFPSKYSLIPIDILRAAISLEDHEIQTLMSAKSPALCASPPAPISPDSQEKTEKSPEA